MLTEHGWSGPAELVADDDGIILEIRPTSSPTPDVRLVPGFVDVQVNGIDDIDVASASDTDWRRLGGLLLDQGVTAWCPTLVTDRLDRFALPLARMAMAQADAQGSGDVPTIIGAHLEGPFIGGAPGAHPRQLIVPIDLDCLAALPPVVRLVTLAAEIPDSAEATELMSARGIVVSIGHSTPTIEAVDAVVAAGARMATHLYNGMSGVHHREPGLAAIALVDDRLTVGLIADLVHVHPLAIQLAFKAKPADRIVLVTDAVAWRAGERRGAAGGTVGGIVMAMRDGAPRLADGTLAGSAVTMDQAVRNVVDVCGVPPDRAIRAASTNPAALMGRADLGRIEVGCRADVVALDPHLAVRGVWLGGRQVR